MYLSLGMPGPGLSRKVNCAIIDTKGLVYGLVQLYKDNWQVGMALINDFVKFDSLANSTSKQLFSCS